MACAKHLKPHCIVEPSGLKLARGKLIYNVRNIRMGHVVKNKLRNVIFTKLEYHSGELTNHATRGSFYFNKRSFESYKRRERKLMGVSMILENEVMPDRALQIPVFLSSAFQSFCCETNGTINVIELLFHHKWLVGTYRKQKL